MAAAV